MHEFLEHNSHEEARLCPKTPEYAEAIQAKTDELRKQWIATLSTEDQIKYNALEKEIIPLLWKYKIPYMLHAWIATHKYDGIDNPIQYHTLSDHEPYSKEYRIDYSTRITGSFATAASILTHMNHNLIITYKDKRMDQTLVYREGKISKL